MPLEMFAGWRFILLNLLYADNACIRFDPIYHIDADMMKPVYKQLRTEEVQRALLFKNLSLERIRRRVREWSIRALKCRRIQLLKVRLSVILIYLPSSLF